MVGLLFRAPAAGPGVPGRAAGASPLLGCYLGLVGYYLRLVGFVAGHNA
jgi:hypothetical protein